MFKEAEKLAKGNEMAMQSLAYLEKLYGDAEEITFEGIDDKIGEQQ